MNSLPIVTWPHLVYRATAFGNNCCCLLSCLIASIFWKLPSHICMIDSETPLAPPSHGSQCISNFVWAFSDVAREISILYLSVLLHPQDCYFVCCWICGFNIVDCAAGIACSMLWIVVFGFAWSMVWFVLLDLRVPFCSLCFWIFVFHVFVCAFGFACSMVWFVLLDLRVPFFGLCFWICVFHVVVCAFGFACSMLWFVLLDLLVPFCSLCFWICVFHIVVCAVGFRCFILCFISRL